MGCNSCSSGGCSPKGCKSNGGCSTGGCNRLNVFDWLSDMDLPTSFEEFDIVEVRFKGGRKDFFRNSNNLVLTTGDPVVVEVPNGYHVGYVSLKGELVRLQMLKKKVDNNEEIRNIYRIANEKDLDKFALVQDLESSTMYRARGIIQELELKMKLSDVEYQADRSKATFYYSADDRVDFRDLIRKLADEFKVRVEMRQISLRHEAGRLGGIGSCGRELCCSTWLSDFKSVSTTAARYQNLSLNPSKLSGQCGRLKCCLNYELETYLDALKDIPTITKPLQLQKGDAILQKTDIFKRVMWFGFKNDNNWYPAPVERVKEILELNSKGIVVESLTVEEKVEQQKKVELVAQLEGNLERLDEKFKSKKKKKKKNKNNQAPALAGVATAVPEVKSNEPKQNGARNENKPQGNGGSGQGQKKKQHKRPFRDNRDNRDNRPPRSDNRPDKPVSS
ncbi:PSP1 domain-containing protein [Adhaeribacter rhizoryzae]|nr:regulatory iron-sulfur-containing complex subunit RicT [Adhaeribacter rhizoryzae]